MHNDDMALVRRVRPN